MIEIIIIGLVWLVGKSLLDAMAFCAGITQLGVAVLGLWPQVKIVVGR